MDLLPFHRFVNCERLEKVVRELNAGGHVSDDVLDAHNEYHFAVVHKLKSAQWFVQNLERYVAEEVTDEVVNYETFHMVNFYFDGFANTVGSALDIFAHEVLHYFNIAPPPLTSFHDLHGLVATARPGDPVCPFLTVPPWREEFRLYRNATTHRVVVAKELILVIRMVGNVKTGVYRFGLPDDPADPQSPCTRNVDIVKYCGKTLTRTLTFFSAAYGYLATRTRNVGGLPLP